MRVFHQYAFYHQQACFLPTSALAAFIIHCVSTNTPTLDQSKSVCSHVDETPPLWLEVHQLSQRGCVAGRGGPPPIPTAREAGYSMNEDGTGFGLWICKQIIDAHGWGITLTESEEGGARFEVTGVEKSE